MFNIGGQGQYIVGAIVSVWIGVVFAGMNPALHILLAIVAATLAGAALGGDRRLPESDGRRPRGDHDDHAQLDRDLGGRRASSATAGSCRTPQDKSVADLERRRREAKLPVFWGEPVLQGLHVGFFIALGALVVFWLAAQPDDARLRGASGRLQPGGGRDTGAST